MAKIPPGTAKLAVTAAGCTVGAMAGIGAIVLFPVLSITFGCFTGIGVFSAIGGVLARGIMERATFGEVVSRHSGAAPDGRIAADLVPKGRADLRPGKSPGSIEGFIGILHRPGTRPLTIEEIGEITAQGWAGRR